MHGSFSIAVLCLLASCAGSSCGSSTGGGNPLPTVTISQSTQAVNSGQSVMLTWILAALGLDPDSLQAVQQEGTQVLAGLPLDDDQQSRC